MTNRMIVLGVTTMVAIGCVLGGCSESGQDNPKQVVISLFGAMEKNDEAALAHLLDIVELMREGQADYALGSGEARSFTDPRQIFADLTGDGETKTEWFKYQRIVNTTQISGESAIVQVTFVDQGKSKGYMTHFGLHKKLGKWRIYSFNVQTEAP